MITKLALAAAAISALAAPAYACRPLEDVLEEYHREFGEVPTWMGTTGQRGKEYMLLLITAPDGSWSAFEVTRHGACIVDFGQNSEIIQRRGNV